MTVRRSTALRLTLGVLAGLSLFEASNARATWPPAHGADLTSASNWPTDPGYAKLWTYFSFLPAQASGSAPYSAPDLALGASGMSIDKAWESSVGSALVRVAVLDSGILWEEPDLLQQVALNRGELTGSHLPLTAGGLACAGLGGYDCNGDGVFTVADYADDPRITPIVTGDLCKNPSTGASKARIAGDLNHNCVLDAGDLVELFSDGVDDDANGYTDDIAGWDFFKNDNNPYDDTRDGHGTTVALQANAQGNNGIASIGACPGCQLLVLRVGQSALSDSNDLAKALIYAADNASATGGGMTVASVAGTTINLTGFAREAIDYADAKNVLVIASMGDDNSREHSLPAAYNHTLTLHGIGKNGSDASPASFVDYVNCTGFGGQLALSASVDGAGCSDEAVGTTTGIAGLLFSYAVTTKLSPALTSAEVRQLLAQTADVIDVPASREASSAGTYYESLSGFSQRFGYGRVNAASAMASLAAGQLPPEVDIVSPAWFDVLHAGRTGGPIAIEGRVVAVRAPSYDLTVEWAPGVEPTDSEFELLADTITNIPGVTVMGGAAPLALLDPSTLDTAHTSDPDSPGHENDRTITIRVRATAHYASGDVQGEARRTVAIVNEENGADSALLPGFPIALSGSIEGSAKLADISGDGVRDIVIGTNDGLLHVISVTGSVPTEPTGFPYALLPVDGLDPSAPDPAVPSYLTAPAYAFGVTGGIGASVTREAINGAPAVGNVLSLDATATADIVFVSWEGTVYAINHEGVDLPGWPLRLPLVPSCPDDPNVAGPPGDCMDAQHDLARGAYASPVLVALEGAGTPLDILVAAFDGNVYAFRGDGSTVPGFPVRVDSPDAYRSARIMSTPAVGDFNGDGVPDILVGSNESTTSGATAGVAGTAGTGFYFLINGKGTTAASGAFLPHWPVLVPSLYTASVVGEGTTASPAIMKVSDVPAALLEGNGAAPLLLPATPGSQIDGGAPSLRLPATSTGRGFAALNQFGALSTATKDTMLPLFGHPSVGDLDQDGVPDVVMAGAGHALLDNLAATTAVPFQQLLAMWSGKTGAMLPGSPFVIEDFSRMTSAAIADVSGDGYPEVIVGTGGYFVHAVDACGREAARWPKFTGGWTMGSPAVGDIVGDHALEVVVGTREGYLYAWATPGTDSGVIEWASFHHDNLNTGNASTALGQGGGVASSVILCGAPTAPGSSSTSDASASGHGCSCSVTSDERGTGGAGWSVAALLGLTLARRRKNARA